MTDPFDRLVALRPPVPDEHGWATSDAGRAALARVQAAGRRPSWWRRRRFVVPTIVIGVSAAVGAGVASTPGGREPVADIQVACQVTADPHGDTYVIDARTGADRQVVVAQCRAEWNPARGPVPADFALCVFPVGRGQTGGAEVGVPSAVTVDPATEAAFCQAAGFDPLD